jgi:hypothetical protein
LVKIKMAIIIANNPCVLASTPVTSWCDLENNLTPLSERISTIPMTIKRSPKITPQLMVPPIH